MDRTERFNKAYEYLRFNGFIKKQEDVAKKMKATRSNVSLALSGNPKVLTNSFLVRFNAAFDYIFSMEWLANGEGSMLIEDLNNEKTEHIEKQNDNTNDMLELYARMIRGIDDLRVQLKDELAEIQTVKSELQQARDDFRNAAYRLTQYLSTLPSAIPQIGMAADEPSTIKVTSTPSTTSPRILRKKVSRLLSDLDSYRPKSTPEIPKNPKK